MKKSFSNLGNTEMADTCDLQQFLSGTGKFTDDECAELAMELESLYENSDHAALDKLFRSIYKAADADGIVAMESYLDECLDGFDGSPDAYSLATVTLLGTLECRQGCTVNYFNSALVMEEAIASFLRIDVDAVRVSPKCIDPYTHFEEGFTVKRLREALMARQFEMEAEPNCITPEAAHSNEGLQEQPVAFDVTVDISSLAGIHGTSQLKAALEGFLDSPENEEFQLTYSCAEQEDYAWVTLMFVGGVASVFPENGYYLELMDFIYTVEDCVEEAEDINALSIRINFETTSSSGPIDIEILDNRLDESMVVYSTRDLVHRQVTASLMAEHVQLLKDIQDPNRVLH